MLHRLTGGAVDIAKMAAGVPLGRAGTAGEIAEAILFISSDKAGFITGQTLGVNCGRTMGSTASSGIGRAAAIALAEAGTKVLIHYGSAEAESVVAEIKSAGDQAEKFKADLSTATGPHELAAQVMKSVTKLDVLVANAGISKAATIEKTVVEDFDSQFALNVRAPFFLVQQLLPVLSESSSVIFTSSLAARAAVGNLSAYAATKGAIDTLVKHFVAALGGRGIRVSAVAPGVVETDMSSFAETDAGKDFTLGIKALKRVAQPRDISGTIAFLASDDSKWITGDTRRIDGGLKL